VTCKQEKMKEAKNVLAVTVKACVKPDVIACPCWMWLNKFLNVLFLNELCTCKRGLRKPQIETVSTLSQSNMAQKCGDPCTFIVPCTTGKFKLGKYEHSWVCYFPFLHVYRHDFLLEGCVI